MSGNLFTGYFIIFLALTTLSFWLITIKAVRRSKNLSHKPTYSTKKLKAIHEKGIFIEHGIVNYDDENQIIPQNKKSRTYYESLV